MYSDNELLMLRKKAVMADAASPVLEFWQCLDLVGIRFGRFMCADLTFALLLAYQKYQIRHDYFPFFLLVTTSCFSQYLNPRS